jgi:hypothetical protein
MLSNARLPQKISLCSWASTLLFSRVGMTKVPPLGLTVAYQHESPECVIVVAVVHLG